MADEKVVIVARMKAKDGMEQTVKDELASLVQATRAEAGCIGQGTIQATPLPLTQNSRYRRRISSRV